MLMMTMATMLLTTRGLASAASIGMSTGSWCAARSTCGVLSAARHAATTAAPTTCVFGHKIPDTDAICAAIVRARELQLDGFPAQPFRLGDLNPETTFVLQHLNIDVPPLLPNLSASACDSVAIVDTNNSEELPDDISEANVTSIVDHHKLAGLTTAAPLEMDLRPLCSTGSVLYHRFLAKGHTISKETASLMLACILSDSLHFRSVTTTEADRSAASHLATISDIDMDELGEAMLEAKSQVSHLSAKDLVLMDSKTYTLHGQKTRVSVVETTHSPSVLSRSSEILSAAEGVEQEEGLDRLLFFVVDIVAERAILLTRSQDVATTVSDAFSKAGVGASVAEAPNSEFHVVLPAVLSRKKQIIPVLER